MKLERMGSKKILQKRVNKILKLVNMLDSQFKKIGINPHKFNNISVDLGDIYEACEDYIKVLKKILLRKKITRSFLIETLSEIEVILYFHMYWHIQKLKNSLKKLIKNFERKNRKYS